MTDTKLASGVTYDGQITVNFRTTNASSRTDYTYWRGAETTFHPADDDFAGKKIFDILTKGFPAPFINKQQSIVAFGSCFADNISIYLNDRGYNIATKKDSIAHIARMGDGIVNSYAMYDQLEWGWCGQDDDPVRLATKAILDKTDVFIFTLGLSEIWTDASTGQVLWRVPKPDKFSPDVHKFRVCRGPENCTNLWHIYDLIKQQRPQAKIVFTLSPIPLSATFRDMPCIVANAASKAHLRSALDEFISSGVPDVHYFPSYELVRECFNHQFMEDRRHVHYHIVMFVMAMFEKYFCGGEVDVAEAYKRARSLDKRVGDNGHWSVQRKSLKNVPRPPG